MKQGATPMFEILQALDNLRNPVKRRLKDQEWHRCLDELPARNRLSEYLVRIQWKHTVAVSKAVKEVGFFGNQNTVCRPTDPKWSHTVARLKQVWNLA